MNAGVIIKLEYLEIGHEEYSEMPVTGFSGSYRMETIQSDAGTSFQVKISARIPKIQKTTTDTLTYLINRKLTVRFTDANRSVHTLGDSEYLARMTWKSSIGGNPGDWNGYELSITWEGTRPHAVEES